MANLIETSEWISGVYQIETTDIALGGSGGVSNAQAIALANRTSFLKLQQEVNRTIIPILSITTSSHTLALTNAGIMLRFEATGAKTLTVDVTTGHTAGRIYHVTNRSTSGDLTLTPAGGMVLNAPKGGTLVLEPGDTVSLHCVSSTVMDVYGSTKGSA